MIANRQFRDIIGSMITGKVLFEEPMSLHTSMGVGGMADVLIVPATNGELKDAVSFFLTEGIPFLPVGNCTNLIVRDGGYRGVLISLEALRGMKVLNEKSSAKSASGKNDADSVFVHAEAGVSLPAIVDFSVGESLTGLEFCA
ncbi:MAG TPA: FAD-binding protein, partial [Syntrophales bacterium]|nr:FAD-binding protein [Syntrophales bacterium]